MNKHEKRLLHGLYVESPIVGGAESYQSYELFWIMGKGYRHAKTWNNGDGTRKAVDISGENKIEQLYHMYLDIDTALSYLKSNGFIEFKREGPSYTISTTGSGADRARELKSFYGRANIVFKRHKDGLLWFLATIIVSAITAYFTKSSK